MYIHPVLIIVEIFQFVLKYLSAYWVVCPQPIFFFTGILNLWLAVILSSLDSIKIFRFSFFHASVIDRAEILIKSSAFLYALYSSEIRAGYKVRENYMSERKLLPSSCVYHLNAITSHCLFRGQNMTPETKVLLKNVIKIHSVIYDLEGSHEKHDNVIIFKLMLLVS